MTKKELINEINSLTDKVYKESHERGLKYYKEHGELMKKELSTKMCEDILAKNLDGRHYLITNIKKEKLETILEELINWCYENKIITSVYDI